MQTMRLTMLCVLHPPLCLALLAATALPTHDENSAARAASPAPSADAARAERRVDAAVLGAGDRLRITFHEKIDMPGGASDGRENADSMLRMFYQRADLSGDYTIDEEGVVSLPLLGRFPAAGLSPGDVEDHLKAAFTRTIGRPGEVSVAVQDRRPVYVVGAVRVPGALKHAGRMIVLQAVALAGGLDRGSGNAAEVIESVHEQERLGKLTRQLERLLARRVRLEAERSGDAMQASDELIALAGKDRAEALISGERTLFDLDQARREQQRAESRAGLSAARKEMEAMRVKLEQIDAQSRIEGEHLDELRKLEGLATATSLIRTRSDMAEIETRRQDIHAALAGAQGKLAQAEGVLARLSLDHAAELATSIAATDAEIADVRGDLDAARLLADRLGGRGGLVTARAAATAQPVYEIVRQGPDGPAVLPAQETTALSPGDVLKIRLEVESQAVAEQSLSKDAGQTAPKKSTQ